jgi:hypothetical protein
MLAGPSRCLSFSLRDHSTQLRQPDPVKLFYTGPLINAEMLVAMLEKHGIIATQAFVDPFSPDDGDLSRPTQVYLPEADYDRSHRLFYTEREDEL